MVQKYRQGSESSSFEALLPASKQRRLDAYKALPRVQDWLAIGRVVAPGPVTV